MESEASADCFYFSSWREKNALVFHRVDILPFNKSRGPSCPHMVLPSSFLSTLSKRNLRNNHKQARSCIAQSAQKNHLDLTNLRYKKKKKKKE